MSLIFRGITEFTDESPFLQKQPKDEDTLSLPKNQKGGGFHEY